MKLNIPKYPEDFYSFKNGVSVSDTDINEWIQKMVDDLIDEEEGSSRCMATGDTKVTVKKYEDEYEIIVAKGYSEGNIERENEYI